MISLIGKNGPVEWKEKEWSSLRCGRAQRGWYERAKINTINIRGWLEKKRITKRMKSERKKTTRLAIANRMAGVRSAFTFIMNINHCMLRNKSMRYLTDFLYVLFSMYLSFFALFFTLGIVSVAVYSVRSQNRHRWERKKPHTKIRYTNSLIPIGSYRLTSEKYSAYHNLTTSFCSSQIKIWTRAAYSASS